MGKIEARTISQNLQGSLRGHFKMSTTPASLAQETSQKQLWQVCKSQDTRTSAVKQALLELAV